MESKYTIYKQYWKIIREKSKVDFCWILLLICTQEKCVSILLVKIKHSVEQNKILIYYNKYYMTDLSYQYQLNLYNQNSTMNYRISLE